MDDLSDLLAHAARIAADYRAGVADRAVAPVIDPQGLRRGFGAGTPLAASGTNPREVIDDLRAAAEPGLVATAGPRYFGFVIGGSVDASVAADVLAAGWDQCAFNAVLSPSAAAVEDVAGGWLKDLLGIPATASVGFVTGGQEANDVGLCAARHHVLREAGWDVESHGLMGAPRVRIIASEERHATIGSALRLLGFGTESVEPVVADTNGAMDPTDLRKVIAAGQAAPTIVIAQAGNVNTGACDDLRAICDIAHARDAWVHVDGAFGLWAAASPSTKHLVAGIELADSWACDGHKWLNVPYDSGFVFCSRPEIHAAAVSFTASYLVGSGITPALADFTLQSSRRARGFAVWAALRQLGRDGVADLIGRNCGAARRFADALKEKGATIANDVVLNQVLVSFGDDAETDRVVDGVQRDGTCWMGGTTWRGRRYMRISVSNHMTTDADVDRSVAAIWRIVNEPSPATPADD